jgi:CheY-like chemotaxis protein
MSNAGTRPTILIVDDDPAIRSMLVEALTVEGFALEVAKDGSEAIAFMTELPATPRIILLDIRMPVVDGYGVSRWLVEHAEVAAQTKVIIVTAYETKEPAAVIPHEAILQKPISLDKVLDLIAKLMR